MKLQINHKLPFYYIRPIKNKNLSSSFLTISPYEFFISDSPSEFEAQNPKEFSLPDFDQEIVFYGGSFNPWHQGHQACIDLLPSTLQLIIVLDRNPQKDITKINIQSYYEDLKSNILIKREGFTQIYPGFLAQETANPTYHWIRATKDKYPQSQLSLLMGFDSFKNISSWINAQELLGLLDKIYVVSRLEDNNMREISLERMRVIHDCPVVFLGHHPYEHLASNKLK